MRRKCYWCEKVKTAKYRYGNDYMCESCLNRALRRRENDALICKKCGEEISTEKRKDAVFTGTVYRYDDPQVFCSIRCAFLFHHIIEIDKDGNEVEG